MNTNRAVYAALAVCLNTMQLLWGAEAIAASGRRLSKRSVTTIYHSSQRSSYMGLDPYEERLLIALLGGGAGLLFALVFLFICCRKYRIDRSGKEKRWNPQMYMQPGRPGYYAMGQPQMPMHMTMDPAMLDPARGHGPPSSNPSYPPVQQQQQQQYPMQQGHVDNTAYASLPSYSQRI